MGDLVLETKLFNLSTRGSSGNVLNADYKSLIEYDIPNMIDRDESVEYIQFSIPYAVIPVSFYIINNTNCQLNVNYNGSNKSYLFPYGNYNANYFISQFLNLLGTSNGWNITLNTINCVFTVTNSLYPFTLLGTSTIDSIMGFSTNLSSTFITTNVLTMSRVCNFLPLPRVTVRCSELANSTMVGSNTSSDVLITIPNNSKPNGQIYYQNQTQAKMLFRHHHLSRFVISFTDDDGNLLNFNGVSSFFVLQFDIFRKFIPKPPRLSNIVEMVNNYQFYYPDEENPIEQNV